MTYTMSKNYDALYDLLCAGGEALGLWGSRDIPALDAVWMRVNPYNKDYLMVGRVAIPAKDRAHFVQECTSWRIEWLAPVDLAGVLEAGDAMVEIANRCYATHGHVNQSRDRITESLRAWTTATAKLRK